MMSFRVKMGLDTLESYKLSIVSFRAPRHFSFLVILNRIFISFEWQNKEYVLENLIAHCRSLVYCSKVISTFSVLLFSHFKMFQLF